MRGLEYRKYALVALSIVGSAILLTACGGEQPVEEQAAETIMTEHSINLTMISTENGAKAYRFQTPLMEGYKLAKDPYMEFREGIDITTYKGEGDTTEVESHLKANYAIYYEQRKLWEVKGNVVAKNGDGQTLYTQQLFWDQKSKRIYSNVDCKVLMGDDYWFGEGFESDEQMSDWHFRRYRGRMWIDADPNRPEDSTSVNKITIPTDSRKRNSNTVSGSDRTRSHLDPTNSKSKSESRPNYNTPATPAKRKRNDEPKRKVEREALKPMEM